MKWWKMVWIISLLVVGSAIAQRPSSDDRNAQLAMALYKKNMPFSASIFVRRHLLRRGDISTDLEKKLLSTITNTGEILFADLKTSVLERYPNSPSLSFVLGMKLFRQQKYAASAKILKRLPREHPLSAQKYFVLGAASGLIGRYEKAHKYYNLCRVYAEKRKEEVKKGGNWEEYYKTIAEKCIVHRGRLYFTQKKYRESLAIYRDIPKTSWHWPYILLEKAWANYYRRNYNRALGLLETYKIPLLKDNYFIPEAEYLRALSFFKMCYWDDTRKLAQEYFEVRFKQAQALKKSLQKYGNSHAYFFAYLLRWMKQQEKSPSGGFVQGIMLRSVRGAKFRLNLYAYLKLRRELWTISRRERPSLKRQLERPLRQLHRQILTYLNHYVKEDMFNFVNQMNKFSYELARLSAEASYQERKKLYEKIKNPDKKDLGLVETLGSQDNIRKESYQHYYSFNGEFWLDELGEYSFGIKSKCLKEDEA